MKPLALRNVGIVVMVIVIAGCTDMYDGARMKPLEHSRFYADGLSARPIPEGTVPRGHQRLDSLLYHGKVNGKLADVFPFVVTGEDLVRGKDRYGVFCSPCHGGLGDGNGMIVQRGFPRPNSFHADSIRVKTAGYYFDVITHGFGRMYSYAPSVPVEDRWKIIAYIRALQLSRMVPVTDLTQAEMESLQKNND